MATLSCLKSVCNGRIVWFGFLAIRLVTLYASEMPWMNMYSDFHCTIDTNEFCRKSCFENQFDKPMVSVWTFTYILFIISVLLLELFSSHLHYKLTKVKMKKGDLVENYAPAAPPSVKSRFLGQKDVMIEIEQQMLIIVLYLAYILLRMHIEIAFLYILVMWHLPKVEGAPIVCSTWLCPGPIDCILQTSVEKHVLVFMLCAISIIIICSSIAVGFYSICFYVVMGRSLNADHS